jgi:hypothetical protein
MEATLRGAISKPLRCPGMSALHRVMAGPIAQEGQRTAEQIAADRVACETSARLAEHSGLHENCLGERARPAAPPRPDGGAA